MREERRLREVEQSSHRSQLDLLEASRTQLRDEMKGISAAVLEKTAESLTRELSSQRRIDDERAAGEMGKRAAELRGLVEPMKEKLGKVESQIELLERERRQSAGQMGEMFRQLNEGLAGLRAETGTLVGALKRPATRGSWGEIQLRNVIEMAGMVAHCDFTEQTTIDGDGGRLRPDVLVRLPGGKLIVSTRRSRSTPTSSRSRRRPTRSAACISRATRARRATTSPSSPRRPTRPSSTRAPSWS